MKVIILFQKQFRNKIHIKNKFIHEYNNLKNICNNLLFNYHYYNKLDIIETSILLVIFNNLEIFINKINDYFNLKLYEYTLIKTITILNGLNRIKSKLNEYINNYGGIDFENLRFLNSNLEMKANLNEYDTHVINLIKQYFKITTVKKYQIKSENNYELLDNNDKPIKIIELKLTSKQLNEISILPLSIFFKCFYLKNIWY